MENTNGILITGDYVIDHHLLKGNKSEASDQDGIGTSILQSYGGARLTYNLIEGFIKSINPGSQIFWPFTEMPPLGSSQGTSHDSYIRWEVLGNVKDGKKTLQCKLYEKLGFGGQNLKNDINWFKVDSELKSKPYRTIVIDEAGIGYRDHKEAWPAFEKADKIILKTTYPLCEGDLWDELLTYKNKLITIVNLSQIKHYKVKVSSGISWEQTALDIIYGLHNDDNLKNLLKSSEVIIPIGSAGAVFIKTSDNPKEFEYGLIFDPESMENEWEEKFSKDIINKVGLGSSFLAGLVSALDLKSLGTAESIKVGLNSMNAAMLKGVFDLTYNDKEHLFATKDISSAINERYNKRYYSKAFVPSPIWVEGLEYINNPEWSILENNYDNRKDNYQAKTDLFPLAFSLAQFGINNLHYAPRLSLGGVTVFDRNEIENLRNIQNQVDFYDRYENGKKPLNISVFGPPGAGKSFIVKAMANNMFQGKNTKPSFLTFNLSQFKDESELPGAFHAVRDEVLKGKLPIVFWDEFDSCDYKWLKSMIAPMQDGEFQEGKEVHPIGKAIFVFAGGMTYTMEHFADKMDEVKYIEKKGPDFLSRIGCSLNVFGPNRKPFKQGEQWKKEGDASDICFSIRRALFIRQLLGSSDKSLNIDQQLLRALVEVDIFKNGSRGLERLLKSLAAHNNRKIELSDLPSKEIIQMNVEYNDIMGKLIDKSNAVNIVFEKIAVSIHNAWLDIKVKESVYFELYEDLSYDGRRDNISAAMRMKDVIEKTGRFILIPEAELRSKKLLDAKEDFDKYLSESDNLTVLAEKEHEGWMETREKANWVPGDRSDYHKLHPCMIHFDQLDKGIEDPALQKQKNKDRNAISKYTSMLAGSGYTIVSTQNQA
jgi:hypothetical protein